MKFQLIWGILMALAYVGIAYLVVFTPLLIPYNSHNNKASSDEYFIVRIALGIILFAYGIFRGYRLWKMTK